MLRSTCFYCGGPQEDPRSTQCNTCQTTYNESREGAIKEGAEPFVAEQAGRNARDARRHHAMRNFVDPRNFKRFGEH